jgi:hypothetical protein
MADGPVLSRVIKLAVKKQGDALIFLRALTGWGTGGFFQKISTPLFLMTTY